VIRVVSRRRRRHERARRVTRLARLILLRVAPAVLLVALGVELWPTLVGALTRAPLLAIDDVRVRGHRFVTPREVAEIAGIYPGAPLVGVDARASASRLLLHPRIARADIDYVFPRSIRISVEERLPAALVECDSLMPISREGIVLTRVPGRPLEDLPVILPPPGWVVEVSHLKSDGVDDALSFLETIEHVSPALVSSISLVDLRRREVAEVFVDSLGISLIYEPGGDWRTQLRMLPSVVAHLDEAGVGGVTLDLRFQDQIVQRGDGRALAVNDSQTRPRTRRTIRALR